MLQIYKWFHGEESVLEANNDLPKDICWHSPPVETVLEQMRLINILFPYFFMFYLSIILPSVSMSSNLLLSANILHTLFGPPWVLQASLDHPFYFYHTAMNYFLKGMKCEACNIKLCLSSYIVSLLSLYTIF